MTNNKSVAEILHGLEDDREFQLALLEEEIIHRVARRVMRFRKLHGISQSELAQRMATRQPRIARIEAAEANLTLRALANLCFALECDVEQLLTESQPRVLSGRWERRHARPVSSSEPVRVRVKAERPQPTQRYVSNLNHLGRAA